MRDTILVRSRVLARDLVVLQDETEMTSSSGGIVGLGGSSLVSSSSTISARLLPPVERLDDLDMVLIYVVTCFNIKLLLGPRK